MFWLNRTNNTIQKSSSSYEIFLSSSQSMTASHIERTLSEVASSLSSHFPPKPGGYMDPTYSLMRIWLLCSELHLRMENIIDAELCVQEAK